MGDVVIVSGARTAVGAFGGSLKDVKCVDLGKIAIKGALVKAGLRPVASDAVKAVRPTVFGDYDVTDFHKQFYDYDASLTPVYVDEVIMGNVLQGGFGQNPGRQSSLYAGIPEETNAYSINKVCASGMKSIALAASAIAAGEAEIIVAGGMENMSMAPFMLPNARWGYRMAMPAGKVIDYMVQDGVYEVMYGYHMGITAENIAAKYGFTREDQDKFALASHQKARAAIANGSFKDEIVPVVMPQRKGDPKVFEVDERPMDTTLEKMAKMAPAFQKGGTVTAGNASGINDAACAVVVMSAEKAKDLGLKPIVKIKGFAAGGVDPAYMGLGPIPAIKKLYNRFGLTAADIGLWELNEAFAVQSLAVMREVGAPAEKTNLLGGAVAIGHPIGVSGNRITFSLALQMVRNDVQFGIAALCIGGGQGAAILLERV